MISEPTEGHETRGASTPPYASFKTFLGLLERMEDGRVPNKVDRSFLSNMSGAYQSQLLHVLRFFSLIDEEGSPTEELRDLVDRKEERSRLLEAKLRLLYAKPVELGEVNGTQAELERAFRENSGIGGSTLQKAIRFYLDAAEFASIPLSPHFRKTMPQRAAGAQARAAGAQARKRGEQTPVRGRVVAKPGSGKSSAIGRIVLGDPFARPGTSARVSLESGGSVLLMLSVDLFRLSETDREFVIRLVDQVRSYQAAHPEGAEGE
jgi:Family of unknown function (DUF5343)